MPDLCSAEDESIQSTERNSRNNIVINLSCVLKLFAQSLYDASLIGSNIMRIRQCETVTLSTSGFVVIMRSFMIMLVNTNV